MENNQRRRSLNTGHTVVMVVLIFFIFLTQIFSYWIFEPLTSFLTDLFEIKLLPIFLLSLFMFLFWTKKEDSNMEL